MKVSQLLATILTATMLVCLLPTMALAADESGIQLGTAGLGADDTVYFGAYNGETVPWYVLSIDSTAQSGFLLSEYLLGTSAFRSNDFGYYSGSTLQGYMDTNTNSLYNTIFPAVAAGQTMAERNAILAADIPCNDFDAASPSVTGAHLYPLSYTEANDIGWGNSKLQAKSINDKGGWPGWWWLRSSYVDVLFALCVDGGGGDSTHLVDEGWGARPAFTLNLTSVLFTSAAVGGKSSGAEGAGALNSNLTPSGATAWKLTLLDSARTFDVTTTAVSTTTAGGDVSVTYSGAKTGTNEYLSAMLTSGSGANETVLYYGRLKSLATSGASGTQDITIPALAAGTYTLKLFNEQFNGDDTSTEPLVSNAKTDYSSAFKSVTLTVSAPAPTITITTEPSDQYVVEGQQATFSVSATGDGLRYQWYINRNDGRGWREISGAISSSHTTSAVDLDCDGFRYGCRITDSHGQQLNSDAATLHVSTAPIPPKTGDSATPGLWLAMCLIGCAGLVILIFKRRRRA